MLDPIPPPPQWLQALVQPLADYLSLPVLALHIHEILFFFLFYQFIQSCVSPRLSGALFPSIYHKFPKRTRLNWDVHVVSLVQSTLINAVALWAMFADQERKVMSWGERVFGYTGACGLVQAMATGYFAYDLIVSLVHVRIFGVGLLLHAISALWVFSLGFRPFVNSYSPTFILYELSSPFLNFHWFFDKLNMTGSRAQWYNGMILLSVFFSCRLVWGTWQSVRVFSDIFQALRQSRAAQSLVDPDQIRAAIFASTRNASVCLDEACRKAVSQISSFAGYSTQSAIPGWLVFTYLGSNMTLNTLNFYWFSKMIEAVMKRFKDVSAVTTKEKVEAVSKTLETEGEQIVLDAASTLEEEERLFINGGLKDSSDDEKIKSALAATKMQDQSQVQDAGVRRRKA